MPGKTKKVRLLSKSLAHPAFLKGQENTEKAPGDCCKVIHPGLFRKYKKKMSFT